MHTYQIIADSSCDLPAAVLQERNITCVPFHVSFDQETYLEELKDITPDEFYQKLKAEKLFPKTSLPSVQNYIDKMEEILKAGQDILCLCLSAKFSGSYQSAVNASHILAESYPERIIKVVDSSCATAAEGLMVIEACRMRDAGMALDEVLAKLEALKEDARTILTVDSLEHLQKGGRIGKVSALAGTILNIKPIIVMRDGELHPENKVRSTKKALKLLADMTKEKIGEQKEQYRVIVMRGAEDRLPAAQEVVEDLRAAGIDVFPQVGTIGITIGAHTGPTPIAICMLKKYEFV